MLDSPRLASRSWTLALVFCALLFSPTSAVAQAASASDVRFKSRYTTGDRVTESVTYVRGSRERYELADMVLIRQHDLKQTVQISLKAETFLITPDGVSVPAAPPPAPDSTAEAPGIVKVITSIVDRGERKTVFGREARRVTTLIDRQPQDGACDDSEQQIETDGWYVDAPESLGALPQATSVEAPGAECRDEVQASQVGDSGLLGFPVGYTTTVRAGDDDPVVMTMEVTEFEATGLNGALFEVPEGMTAAANASELARAISDANEGELAAGGAGGTTAKAAGAVRIAVPELANETTEQVDTRALRTRLIALLAEQNVDAVPLAAAPPEELEARAAEQGADYLLHARVVELSVSTPGRFGRMVNSATGDGNKNPTEAELEVELMPVGGGEARLSETVAGEDGGLGLQTGLRLVRLAATLYLRYASPLSALNQLQMLNLGGLEFLNNPLLMELQGGAGPMGGGDRTASAAMFLLDQAMSGASALDAPGVTSFDGSLGDALGNVAEEVSDELEP